MQSTRGDVAVLLAFELHARLPKPRFQPLEIRELKHVIERAAILARGPIVQVEDLVSRPAPRKETPAGARKLEDVERTHILTALEQAGWVIEGSKGAAQVLGLHPNTLRYRLKKLGIQRPA